MGANKLGVFLSAARSRGGAAAGGGIDEIQVDGEVVATTVTELNFQPGDQPIVGFDQGGGLVTIKFGKIVTHSQSPAGSPFVAQDLSTGVHVALGHLVTVDVQGDVIYSLN